MNNKNHVKNARRSAKAISLVACMLLCAMVPMVSVMDDDSSVQADGLDQFNYVSLGDSMVNGFGMLGYYSDGINRAGFLNIVGDEPGESNTYPNMISEYLGSKFDVNHTQLAISGMRTADLRVLLDDTFTGEELSLKMDLDEILAENGYPAGEEGLSELYIDALTEADLISYQFNFDFGMYIANALTAILNGIDNGYSPNFDAYIDAEILQFIRDAKAQIIDIIIEELGGEESADPEALSAIEAIDGFASALTFVILSYCLNFDANIGAILEMNKDVEILVIDNYSTNSELIMDYNGTYIPVGKVMAFANEVSNFYAKYLSAYSCKVSYVTLEGIPDLLADPFSVAADYTEIPDVNKDAVMASLTSDFIFRFEMNPVIDHTLDQDYDRIDKHGNLTRFIRCLFDSNVLTLDVYGKDYFKNLNASLDSIDKLLGDLENDTPGILEQEDCVIVYDAEACTMSITSGIGSVEMDRDLMIFMWLHVRVTNYTNIMGHLSEVGHEQTFEAIRPVLDAALEERTYTLTIDMFGEVTETVYKEGDFIVIPSLPIGEMGYMCIWDPFPPSVMPASDLTLTAVCVPIVYTLVFDPNGGEGTMEAQDIEYDSLESIHANAFHKDGYSFDGWNTAADGTGTAYQDQAEVMNLAIYDGDTITLYAQWKESSSGGLPMTTIAGIAAGVVAMVGIGAFFFFRH